MIITRTPFRVSLAGGGTDLPAWYEQHGGAVIGFALNRYCWISLRRLPPFFEHRHRIAYSRIETVRATDAIQHPVVRAVFARRCVVDGLELHHDGDLPARSGLGSSSAFTVGLLHALTALQGGIVSKRDLANEAITIEQTVIGEAVGSQDQIWAAFGGVNRIDFTADGFSVRPLVLPPARLDLLLSHLMLFYTGLARTASEVEAQKIAALPKREIEMRFLQDGVGEVEAILGEDDLAELGPTLDMLWRYKRELAPGVSNPAVDRAYEAAKEAGATGGKLLGAGGGGFLLLFVPPDDRGRVRNALNALIEVPVGVDRDGSRMVVYEPDGWR